MTTTYVHSRDLPLEERKAEMLNQLNWYEPVPTLYAKARLIAKLLHEIHEQIDGRAEALGWLAEFGDDAGRRAEAEQFIRDARDLRMLLHHGVTSTLTKDAVAVGAIVGASLANVIVPGVDELECDLRDAWVWEGWDDPTPA